MVDYCNLPLSSNGPSGPREVEICPGVAQRLRPGDLVIGLTIPSTAPGDKVEFREVK